MTDQEREDKIKQLRRNAKINRVCMWVLLVFTVVNVLTHSWFFIFTFAFAFFDWLVANACDDVADRLENGEEVYNEDDDVEG